MTENNAAHQNYLEAHRAVRDVLEANAVYFGGNTINAIVDAVLSKQRAESVQAGDEQATVHNAAIKAAAKVCADIARQYDPQNNQENALASELYSAEAAILKLVKEDHAPLASAPVAGKARPVAYAVHGIDARGKIRVAAVKPWAGDESLCDSDGLGDMWSGNEPLVYANAAPQASKVATAAAHDVLAERRRQVDEEGFKVADDNRYQEGQLSAAAAAYTIDACANVAGHASLSKPPSVWPWDPKWWRPEGARRNLVKAAALILAEIERLDRAAIAQQKGEA
ncbi:MULTISPECIES: hypothetical protein [Achromobacter]|uniref:hypothetical protein n=1 Tax=Achromobacter TaxID=222 RepID=UPI0023F7A2AD|nr:hypothetical protein [Achromobacter anxifer]MDF8363323.1 hypothetical protein [Achromobacter anxifer]